MVKKLFDKLIKENLEVLSSSLKGLWEKMPKGGAAGGGGGGGGGQANDSFNKMKEKMGTMAGKPMSRSEALMIMNIDEEEYKAEDHDSDDDDVEIPADLIMERFGTLIEKNQISKGGSFYLQSKIYWAKH